MKQALAAVKDEARACGPRHAAAAGTVVRVKLSVEDGTGRVATATAEGEHRDTPLGRCVAAAFAQARFPPTRRHGVSYSLRLD